SPAGLGPPGRGGRGGRGLWHPAGGAAFFPKRSPAGAPPPHSGRWRRFPALFLGAALDDAAQSEAQEVEFVADGLDRGETLVGVALALDKLLADLGCREAAIQPGGLEGGVGLEMVSQEIGRIRTEVGGLETS